MSHVHICFQKIKLQVSKYGFNFFRNTRKDERHENEHEHLSDLSGAPTSFGAGAQEKLIVHSHMEGEGREWVAVEKRDVRELRV